jgi:hypothetical protein
MELTKTVKRQIEKIRVSRAVNMLLTFGVQQAAFNRGYYELYKFIEENRNAYLRYILTGEDPPDENCEGRGDQSTYRVTITETLKFSVDIYADSAETAERIAEQNWNEGDYIIDSAHFAGVEFHAEKE